MNTSVEVLYFLMRLTVGEYKFICDMSKGNIGNYFITGHFNLFLQTNFLNLSEVNNCCIFCRMEEVMLENGIHLVVWRFSVSAAWCNDKNVQNLGCVVHLNQLGGVLSNSWQKQIWQLKYGRAQAVTNFIYFWDLHNPWRSLANYPFGIKQVYDYDRNISFTEDRLSFW